VFSRRAIPVVNAVTVDDITSRLHESEAALRVEGELAGVCQNPFFLRETLLLVLPASSRQN
jgi:hypothetical protein